MIISANHLNNFIKKYHPIFIILIVFLLLRLPGIDLPYHQDEWKNVASAQTIETAGQFFTHPPLMQMILVAGHNIFGDDYARMIPLIFSVGSLLLLYGLIKKHSGYQVALAVAILYSFCIYGIYGSLVPDVDGSVLPFFLVLAIYFYDKFINYDEYSPTQTVNQRKFLFLLILTLLLGLLVKLSFIIVVGTLFIDYLWTNRKLWSLKKIIVWIFELAMLLGAYFILLLIIEKIYPAFSLQTMFGHANQYSGLGRNWMQIIVQFVKAVYYLSPLLLIPILFVSKEQVKKNRLHFIFLALGLIFYFIIFDFSRGALDKYLVFAVLPLSVICGTIVSGLLNGMPIKQSNVPNLFGIDAKSKCHSIKPFVQEYRWSLLGGLVIVVILIALNFLPHSTVPLYPKEEWFADVIHGKWNILNPFTGGSGPLGFYVSFLFIASSYIISIIVALYGLFKKKTRVGAMVILVMIGLTYNIIFAEELYYGKINGNSTAVLNRAMIMIEQSDSIKKVMTYNDIGNQYLSKIGKYGGRIYATPDYEKNYRKKFAEFSGHYLVVNIPRINDQSFYAKFFAQCQVVFQAKSGQISATVYQCLDSREKIDSI